MSCPEHPLVVLSPKARQDFVDILRYTLANWGREQLAIYRDRIDSAIQRIYKNPQIGALRNDLNQPYRTLAVGVHVIVYRQQSNRIRIVRILHQRMDPANHH